MDWIDLAQDTYRRRVLVKAVMKIRVSKHEGNFLDSCGAIRC
jgi:hypothetical protein